MTSPSLAQCACVAAPTGIPSRRGTAAAGVSSSFFFFFLMMRPPPRSTLFPYPTLFRSLVDGRLRHCRAVDALDEHGRLRGPTGTRSEEHTSELQSPCNLVCPLFLSKNRAQYTCGRPLAPYPRRIRSSALPRSF